MIWDRNAIKNKRPDDIRGTDPVVNNNSSFPPSK